MATENNKKGKNSNRKNANSTNLRDCLEYINSYYEEENLEE